MAAPFQNATQFTAPRQAAVQMQATLAPTMPPSSMPMLTLQGQMFFN